MVDRCGEIIAFVVLVQLIFGEGAEQHRTLAFEHAGVQQLIEQALDPVRVFRDVFQKQDAALDVR